LPFDELAECGSSKVERCDDVCGGQACVAGTRIPIYILEQYRRLGASEDQLLDLFPVLSSGDLIAAWEYVGRHYDEIDSQIARD
jgi:uncharacterized protein (DUF433 family)